MNASDNEFSVPQPESERNADHSVGSKLSRAMLTMMLTAGILLLGVGLLSTGWATPSQDEPMTIPTRTPMPITMTLAVNLQRPNASPPSAPWAVPVALAFYPAGNAVTMTAQHTVTLDQNGRWTGALNLPSGAYDVRVKNLHTLRNVKRNVQVTQGMTIDMGTLREGDADGDNRVRIFDFAILRAAYFTRAGDATFDPRADFDEDHRIRISDFALLRSNYFAKGDIEVSMAEHQTAGPQPQGVVALALEPAQIAVKQDEVFTITVMAHSDEQPFIGLDAEIRFPPTQLQVIGADGLPTTGVEISPALISLLNQVDNAQGAINLSVGIWSEPINGDLGIARLRFKVISGAASIPIYFGEVLISDPDGRSVTGPLSSAVATMSDVGHFIYLPTILSASR